LRPDYLRDIDLCRRDITWCHSVSRVPILKASLSYHLILTGIEGNQKADNIGVSVVEVPHVKPLQSLHSTLRKPAHVTAPAPLHRCVSAPNLSYIHSTCISRAGIVTCIANARPKQRLAADEFVLRPLCRGTYRRDRLSQPRHTSRITATP
jgi:hypothetical protein